MVFIMIGYLLNSVMIPLKGVLKLAIILQKCSQLTKKNQKSFKNHSALHHFSPLKTTTTKNPKLVLKGPQPIRQPTYRGSSCIQNSLRKLEGERKHNKQPEKQTNCGSCERKKPVFLVEFCFISSSSPQRKQARKHLPLIDKRSSFFTGSLVECDLGSSVNNCHPDTGQCG